MRITLANWLYNAGIIGFLRILKEADPSIDVTGLISKGDLEVSRELLGRFDIGYAKYVLKKANPLRQKVGKGGGKVAPLVDIYRVPDAELSNRVNNYRGQISDTTTKDELKACLKGFIVNSYGELKYFIENSADEQVRKAWSRHSAEWDEYKKKTVAASLDFYFVYSYLQQFYKNLKVVGQAVYKTGKESYEDRMEALKTLYVDKAIAKLDSVDKGDVTCKFCQCAKIEVDKDIDSEYIFLEKFFYPVGLSLNKFSNFFYNLASDLFICDVCKVIMLSAFAGLTAKNPRVDIDETNYIFVSIPSLPLMWKANEGLQAFYERSRIHDESIYEVTLQNVAEEEAVRKSRWARANILFVELKTVGNKAADKPVFKYFHITKDIAELFTFLRSQTQYPRIRNISGSVRIVKDKKKQPVNLKIEAIKRLFRGENLYNLAFMSATQALDRENGNPPAYTSIFAIAGMQALRKQIRINLRYEGGEHMEAKRVYGVLRGFYERGKEDFPTKSEDDLKKKERMAYRLLSLIRMGKYADFYEAIMKLYITSNKPIPQNLLDILNQESPIDFEAKAYAFMSGFLSGVGSSQQPIKKEEVTND